ncbi:DoxX family protein [Verrucomicrobiota bacterium]
MKPSIGMGLLVLRVGIGMMFMLFGWPKITGGPEKWTQLGGAMAVLGVVFAPVFWGFMAAVAEFVGGLALLLGVLVRPFAAMMAFTMAVAAVMLVKNDSEFLQYSHAIDMLIVFVALLIAGGGNYTLGSQIAPLAGKWYE